MTYFKTQLRDQSWILRNKVKRLARSVVDTHYGLHPPLETLAKSKEKRPGAKKGKSQKEAFIKQRVAELLGRLSPFLCGDINDVRKSSADDLFIDHAIP